MLMGLKLPTIDSVEVLRRTRRHAATRAIPVMVVTSCSGERDIVDSYGLGVAAYLTKPVTEAAFAELIANIPLAPLPRARAAIPPRPSAPPSQAYLATQRDNGTRNKSLSARIHQASFSALREARSDRLVAAGSRFEL